jgi:hypothetical protein
MKKLFTAAKGEVLAGRALKTGLSLLAGVALASGLWFASSPKTHAATMTPAEMIQSQLPSGKTIATATEKQLLDAVCKAVKKWTSEAALIVRTAAGARKELRNEILCTAIRCLHQDCGWSVDILREWSNGDPKEMHNALCGAIRCLREDRDFNCTCVVNVLRVWIKAEPNETSRLTELALQCAPSCRDALQKFIATEGTGAGNFANPPANVNAPPGSVGGGAGGNVCIVCHNGQQIQVACSDLDAYLRSHPGDTAGACQPTPVTNP